MNVLWIPLAFLLLSGGSIAIHYQVPETTQFPAALEGPCVHSGVSYAPQQTRCDGGILYICWETKWLIIGNCEYCTLNNMTYPHRHQLCLNNTLLECWFGEWLSNGECGECVFRNRTYAFRDQRCTDDTLFLCWLNGQWISAGHCGNCSLSNTTLPLLYHRCSNHTLLQCLPGGWLDTHLACEPGCVLNATLLNDGDYICFNGTNYKCQNDILIVVDQCHEPQDVVRCSRWGRDVHCCREWSMALQQETVYCGDCQSRDFSTAINDVCYLAEEGYGCAAYNVSTASNRTVIEEWVTRLSNSTQSGFICPRY